MVLKKLFLQFCLPVANLFVIVIESDLKPFNSKHVITSKELFISFYLDEVEYKRLINVVLTESHRFRFKKGLRLKLDENEIFDVTSACLLKLLEQIHKKESKGELIHDVSAYYARSFEHELYIYLNQQNKNRNRSVYLGDFTGFEVENEQDDNPLLKETLDSITENILTLNEKERLIIKMQFSDALLQKEIGEILNMSADSVKTTLFRAMKKLRKLLAAKRNTK